MSKIDDGGQAFPQTQHLNKTDTSVDYIGSVGGMSLRDYFAAAALQGFLANSSNEFVMLPHVNLASEAYMVADAMLAARKEAND